MTDPQKKLHSLTMIKEFDLGDISTFGKEISKQESASIQNEYLNHFLEYLETVIPNGAHVTQVLPMSLCWKVTVSFTGRETNTEAYRLAVKKQFKDATVATLSYGGDVWKLPYQSGIHTNHSKKTTFVLTLLFACVLWGFYLFLHDKV